MLARAYQFLSTPFTTSLNLITVDGYSLKDTRNALLGHRYGKIVAQLLFDEINELVNTDVDVLDFVAVNPQYNPLKYQPDGLRTTRKECNLMAAEASNNSDDYGMDWTSMPSLSQLPPVINGTSSPATLNPPPSSPSDVIESSEPLRPAISTEPSAEDLARLDTVAPSSIPTPISASTSTSASAAASAYSSASSSNPLPSAGLGPTHGIPSPPTVKGVPRNSPSRQDRPSELTWEPGTGPTTSKHKQNVASSTPDKRSFLRHCEWLKGHVT